MRANAAMGAIREWLDRLRGTFHPSRRDDDLEQELRLHAELAAEDARRRGHSPEHASRVAAVRAGGLAASMERLRDQRGLPWLDDASRDLRHAVRLLRRNPIFTGVAVLSLALGIGANAAIFSLADVLLLRPLPIRDPGSVMTVSTDAPEEGRLDARLSYPNYRDLRQATRTFSGLAAYDIGTFSFARSRQSVRDGYMAMLVSDNFFEVLGVQPALGRSFTADEGRIPGRGTAVVLSHDFWNDALAADPSVLGSVVWINGIPFHVVGVTPASFTGPEPPVRPAFYLPVVMAQRLDPARENPLENRKARVFRVKGRLARGVSQARAQAEFTTIWSALQRQYPDADRRRVAVVRTELQDRAREDPDDAMLLSLLGGLAGLVLIIACANVANLMLGRARGRSREIAVRLALGVSRSRLLRQLLTESLLLALAGLALGLAFAFGGIRFLQTIPVQNQIVIRPELDHRVLLFGVLAAIVSALVFGIAPARQSLETELVPALKTSTVGEAVRNRTIGRNILVTVQVALSMVLLVAMGMLFGGVRRMVVQAPGFRTDHLLVMSFDTSAVRDTPAQTHAFYRDVVNRAAALPGVVSASLASVMPFEVGVQYAPAVIPEGYRFPPGQGSVSTLTAVVGERYFSTMAIAMLRGRPFSEADTAGAAGVAIVNEQFAKTYWPDRDPIGKRLRLAESGSPWLEVIGVTKTAKYWSTAERPTPFFYLPFAQHEKTAMRLLVETRSTDPTSLAAPLRGIVRDIDVRQPIFDTESYSRMYRDRAITVPLMLMQMVGTIALLGLALALAGLYGLVAYSVARRTREIGIRMAIGAARADVLRMVLRQGLVLSLAGILVGSAATVFAAPLIAANLQGLAAPSTAVYVLVPLALICLTMGASYVPARRASRVDPLVALRDE
ncbi:MAG TPA: ABC transporter permease [Vicinamibacterales bacterium]|nr:ABC transporter permease [Vicinamibacterales bacterium]